MLKPIHRRLWRRPALVALLAGLLVAPSPSTDSARSERDPYAEERARLVKNIATDTFGRDAVKDEAVLDALRAVPRHVFVPESQRREAYRDKPLPIGYGQTISQPYIVASMTELLEVDSDDVVLEIGTGSGYQTAVLAEIVQQVYTIEIVPELADSARDRLKRLGYENVEVRTGDGYNGWAEHGPYDAIIVTAAASHIPPPLIEQLKPGGKMVIPVGPVFQVQQLMRVEKDAEGKVRQRSVMPVRFVPLTGGPR